MQKYSSVTTALQSLEAKGYHLADTLAEPDDAIRSHDWRLDSVDKIREEGKNSILIAVSSTNRRLKLVFVEYGFSSGEFSPVNLLRKLFPRRNS